MKDNYKLLMHGWGNTPEQKRKAAEYNHKYYQENKEKWEKYRKSAEQHGDILEKSQRRLESNIERNQNLQNPYNRRNYKVGEYREITSKDVNGALQNFYDKNGGNSKDKVKTTKEKLAKNYYDTYHDKIVLDLMKKDDTYLANPANRTKLVMEELPKWKANPDSYFAKLSDQEKTPEKYQAWMKWRAETKQKAEAGAMDEARRLSDKNFAKINDVKGRKEKSQARSKAMAENEVAKQKKIQLKSNTRTATAQTAEQKLTAAKNIVDKRLEETKKKEKYAKRQEAYNNMKAYEMEREMEKNAPLYKKARKLVDGTVEVALDNAKNALSKLKLKRRT